MAAPGALFWAVSAGTRRMCRHGGGARGSRAQAACAGAIPVPIGALLRSWRPRNHAYAVPAEGGRLDRMPGRRRPRAARPPRATHRRGKVTNVGGTATRRHPRHTPAAAPPPPPPPLRGLPSPRQTGRCWVHRRLSPVARSSSEKVLVQNQFQ